jgi:hypothetical protein
VSYKRQPPDPELVASVTGELGELLAAMWYQGALQARVRVSPIEVEKSRGHGVEISQDTHTGAWTLIAVNHPWTWPTENEETDERQHEHDLGVHRPPHRRRGRPDG